MDITYKTEIDVLKNVLWGEPLEIDEGVDLEALRLEFARQSLTGLASFAKWPSTVPENERQAFRYASLYQAKSFFSYCEAQGKILALFEKRGIPVVVLKGCAAAINYPTPELRAMGDVDLIVRREDFADAFVLLMKNGCEFKGKIYPGKASDSDEREKRKRQAIDPSLDDLDEVRQVKFLKGGIEIELHRTFGLENNQARLDAMMSHIYSGMEHIETAEYQESRFPMLPPLENGLVLLEHAAQHILNSGVGFRQVIDWMMYVHKHLTDEFWESRFKAAADDIGLGRLAVSMTYMCQKHLGLDGALGWPAASAERDYGISGEKLSELSDELLEFVLDNGNFGRKKKNDRGAAERLISKKKSKKDSNFFSRLSESGLQHGRVLREHRFLSHFAWIYGGFRYIGIMIREGYGPFKLYKNVKQVSKADRMIGDLDIE